MTSTTKQQTMPSLLKRINCSYTLPDNRVHIVGQRANGYIVAFHIAISHDIYWVGPAASSKWVPRPPSSRVCSVIRSRCLTHNALGLRWPLWVGLSNCYCCCGEQKTRRQCFVTSKRNSHRSDGGLKNDMVFVFLIFSYCTLNYFLPFAQWCH